MATNNDCSILQRSLSWCEGTPVRPGIRRRIYYISKSEILSWPTLATAENGRAQSGTYTGSFTLKADSKWKHIDVLVVKSGIKSDPEGEYPSQLQKNTLNAFYPGIDEQAAAAAAYLNNSDNVFLVQGMDGKFRVVGSEMYECKTTVAQDSGQGPTGDAGTTITAEVLDIVPAPFYTGQIDAEAGMINAPAA